jgi:hypothetical protein
MTIGLMGLSLAIGCILGLAFAIWIVKTAGYNWRQILHRCHIELLARRYRGEDLTDG